MKPIVNNSDNQVVFRMLILNHKNIVFSINMYLYYTGFAWKRVPLAIFPYPFNIYSTKHYLRMNHCPSRRKKCLEIPLTYLLTYRCDEKTEEGCKQDFHGPLVAIFRNINLQLKKHYSSYSSFRNYVSIKIFK